MGCLCKSLLCVAYSPPATKHPPPTPTLMPGQIYFNSLLTDVVGFEAGKSDSRAADFKNGRPRFIYLLTFFSLSFLRFQRVCPRSTTQEGGRACRCRLVSA